METKARYVELISDFHCERCPCDADTYTQINKQILPTYLCASCAIQEYMRELYLVIIEIGWTPEQFDSIAFDILTEEDELIGFSANEIEIDGVLIEIKRVGINKLKTKGE